MLACVAGVRRGGKGERRASEARENRTREDSARRKLKQTHNSGCFRPFSFASLSSLHWHRINPSWTYPLLAWFNQKSQRPPVWIDVMNRKTCNLRRPVLSLLYLFSFVRHFLHSGPVVWKYMLRHPPLCNIVISFYILVTSKPEEGWSGQPKYCFKYKTLFQPCQHCSSLSLIFVLVFKFGWLDLLRSDVQSSRIFVHGFAVY